MKKFVKSGQILREKRDFYFVKIAQLDSLDP